MCSRPICTIVGNCFSRPHLAVRMVGGIFETDNKTFSFYFLGENPSLFISVNLIRNVEQSIFDGNSG